MRIFQYTLKNILRTLGLSLSTMGVLTFLIFLIQILSLLNYGLGGYIDRFVDRFDIPVYLKSEFSDENNQSILQLQIDLAKQFPDQEIVTFYSRQDSLDNVSARYPGLIDVLEGENRLPGSLYFNVELSNIDQIVEVIDKYEYLYLNSEKDRIVDFKRNISLVQKEVKEFRFTRNVVSFVLLLFVFVFLFVIYSSIVSYVSFFRDEILVTKLVGGSSIFVYGPFIAYGAINMFVSFMLAFLLLHALKFFPQIADLEKQVGDTVYSLSSFLQDFFPIFMYELGAVVLLGAMFGGFSGWWVLRRRRENFTL